MSLVQLSALAAYMLASDNLADIIEDMLEDGNDMDFYRDIAAIRLAAYKKARTAYEAML